MKIKFLRFKKAIKAALFVLLLNAAGLTKTHADNIPLADITFTANGLKNSDSVTMNRDYSDLPTFEFNGHNYKVAPDPHTSYVQYINWISANAYCENLTLYGYSDWRMPTIEELEMMYLNKSSIGGFFDGQYSLYHSSTLNTEGTYHIQLSWGNGSRDSRQEYEYNGYRPSSTALYNYNCHVRPIRVETVTPIVTTNNVTDISPMSAVCGGNVTDGGVSSVVARGVCWSLIPNPTISNSHTIDGNGTGAFTSNITGLNPGTQYYVRAYASNSEGTAYGSEKCFTTPTAMVTTNDVTSITQTSAVCGGFVTSFGGVMTARGVCWSVSNQNPTINDNHTTDGTGACNFTSNLIGLTQNTTYYVRAYVTCGVGTVYGETKQFNTTKFEYRISEGGVIATSAGGYFYDSGGPNGNYNNNEQYTMTFMSNQGAGTKIQMTFTQFYTDDSYDYLMIYDGMNTSAPLIGTYYGNSIHSYPGTVTATNTDGALTFVFISDNSYTSDGWKAAISIVTPSNIISVSASPSNGGMVSGGGGYENGEICTLTATPTSGFNFIKWTKNGTQVSTNSTYTFTVTESASYVAHFSQNNYTISTSANPSNGGMVTGGGTYSYGTNCTLTATANTGYTFVNWTKNGTVVSTNPSYSFTVTEAAMYVANFQQQQTQSYVINALVYPTTGGTVTGGGTYNHGASCTLTATPSAGYTFTNWKKGNTVVSTNATYTFTVTEAASYTANFTLNSYAIAATANPTAGGMVSGAGTYNHGVSCTLTASANTGYTFVNWTESGTIVSTNATYAFSVTNNRTLVANFQQQQSQSYAINVSANPTIGGTVAGGGTYTQGVTCTLTATANNGYVFVDWKENGTVVSTSSTYSFTVTGVRTLVAHFNQIPNTGNIVFADANVKAICVANWDTNGDGELSYAEAATVTELGQVFKNNSTITSFDELQYFTGLTTIGEKDFYYCTNLTSVVFPSTITSIGTHAFYDCEKLVSSVLPSSIETIDHYAFAFCYALTSVEIPAATSYVYYDAYYYCRGLEQITVDGSNVVYDSRNACNALIETGTNKLIFGCKNTVIPNTVTEIGDKAFYACSGLESIAIPNSVISIGANAFYDCYNLVSINIPNSVNSIGNYAFYGCSAITSIVIPSSVTSIGYCAVSSCRNLAQVSVDNGNAVYDSRNNSNAIIETNSNKLIVGCKNTIIPNSVTAIGNRAFYNCEGFTSIDIPNSVTEIEQYAFAFCYYLTSMEIPSFVTTIGDYAFYYCTGLTSIASLVLAPPVLGNNVFKNVDKSIPVYVPCVSMYAYQNASGWDEFTNITSSTVCNSGQITVTVNPAEGGTVTGGGYFEGGAVCTLTATANAGYSFINWTKDGEEVYNSETYSFNVDGDATYSANFEQGVTIGSGTATNQYLPSYSWYKYALSQQIYTADEIGGDGTIASIAFFNAGATKTRSYNVYMVHTDKQSFENSTDWITVTENDLVFSGEVTMTADTWTRLQFDTPFQYDGVSNIVLVVDDNSGNYTGSPHMACTVFEAQGNQAIRIYSDGTDYDPYNPSVYGGTLHSEKNQIRLGFASTQAITFADANVKALCVANWDTDGDGELSYAEAAAVTDLEEVFKNNTTITSFDELQFFTGLTEIGNRAFYSCNGLTSVVIPNSVTVIDQYAFANCYHFTSVGMPCFLTTIGDYAFYNCGNQLTSITIPNTVTTIGNYAFYFCYGLVLIDIPASVTSIGNYAFFECKGLEQITVAEDNEVYDSRDNCNAIIETTTNILRYGCKNSFIPNTVVALGDCAFRFMDIPSVNIPESVVTIGSNVFGGCQLLEQITVAEGNSVFDSRDNCNAVVETGTNKLVFGCKNTVIPNTVTTIGEYAFYNCLGLTSIAIPNSVTAINQYAFANCYSFLTVELPNYLTTIGNYAFYNCGNQLTSITIPNMVTSIGNYAFYYCYGLVSIEIPTSLTSIGYYAFANCTALTSITSLAQTPPTLGNNAFSNVDKTIPVYIPCVSMYAYQNAAGWNEFTNYTSSTVCNSGEITVTASPAEGGTVTGGGYYEGGAVCTLTAIVNEGYIFINWTKDGVEVSNSETYSFNVDGDATCVANFEQGVVIGSGTATNQYLPSYSYYKYALSQQIYTADEIGSNGAIASIAFFNAGATKTRSYNVYMVHTDKLSFESSTDWITVTESDLVFSGEVTMTADAWTRLQFDTPFQYDGVSNIALIVDDNSGNYTVSPHMACTVFDAQGNQAIRIYSDGTDYDPYNPSGYYGTLHSEKNQVRLGFASTPSTFTQTTNLSRGWNWYSTYIEQDGIDGLSQLENSIGVPNAIIQSQYDGYVKSGLRNGRVVWKGALTSINNEEMYKIGTRKVRIATMEGEVADPANHPITIYKGWNWIGFPCSQSVSVNEALSGFTPKNGDAIKGIHSYATYSNGTWSGTLNTLEPGQGYMYGSKDRRPKTLVYQSGRSEATLANITPENNYYQPVDDYADNMTLTAVIELDGEELRSEDYELAAFVGDECRGSVKLMYVESLNRYVAFLTVFGDEAEDMHFVLTDGATSDLSADYMTYATDGIVGTLDEPVVLRFGATDVNENALANVRIYPNPSNGVFNVEGVGIRKVEVTNAYGQTILSEEVENDNLQINLSDKAAGAYLLRVVTDKGVTTKKLIKE